MNWIHISHACFSSRFKCDQLLVIIFFFYSFSIRLFLIISFVVVFISIFYLNIVFYLFFCGWFWYIWFLSLRSIRLMPIPINIWKENRHCYLSFFCIFFTFCRCLNYCRPIFFSCCFLHLLFSLRLFRWHNFDEPQDCIVGASFCFIFNFIHCVRLVLNSIESENKEWKKEHNNDNNVRLARHTRYIRRTHFYFVFFFLVKQEMGFSYFANLANENEMKNTIREYNYVLLQAIIYFFIINILFLSFFRCNLARARKFIWPIFFTLVVMSEGNRKAI